MENKTGFVMKSLAAVGAAYLVKKALDYAVELEREGREHEWRAASACDNSAHYDMDGVSFDPEVKVVIGSDGNLPKPERLGWMSRARRT